MGLFNAANQWRQAILFLPGMVGVAGFPMLSSLSANSHRASFRKVFWTNLTMSGSIAAVLAVAVTIAAPFIMATYGNGFLAGQTILIVLCGVAVITATLNVVGQAIASEGHMWFGFLLNTVWAGALMSAGWALIPRQGALGLALANLIAYGVHLVTVSIYLYFRLHEPNRR